MVRLSFKFGVGKVIMRTIRKEQKNIIVIYGKDIGSISLREFARTWLVNLLVPGPI